jgi:hypothetical protein
VVFNLGVLYLVLREHRLGRRVGDEALDFAGRGRDTLAEGSDHLVDVVWVLVGGLVRALVRALIYKVYRILVCLKVRLVTLEVLSVWLHREVSHLTLMISHR